MPKPPTDWHHSQRHKPIPESPVNKARRLRTERIAKVIAEAQASAEVRQFPAQPERPKPEAPVLLSPQIPGRDLRLLVQKIGERQVLRELNVHEKTLYRWLTGRIQIPGRQHLAIKALLGDLPGTAGKWSGWMFHQGELVSPEGTTFTPGNVRASTLQKSLISSLRQANDKLKIRLAIAEEALQRLAPAANDLQALG